MKIKQLELENFKNFQNHKFDFNEGFNLLIGDNGKGKTAVLDALAIGLSDFASFFNEQTLKNIQSSNVRLTTVENAGLVQIIEQYPVRLTYHGILEQESLTWQSQRPKKNQNRRNNTKVKQIADQVKQKIQNQEEATLPIIAYYGTDRLWKPAEEKSSYQFSNYWERGYQNCLHPDSHINQLVSWLEQEEKEAIQNGEESHSLQNVKGAIATCMENWQTVTYDIQQDEVVATAKDGTKLPLKMLSDGVRNMLAMVGDIAYRTTILNPHLTQATQETLGVVLIDEIDLHLHPSWQRRVVEDLKRTFPKIQFFATTHSPFIIQSLEALDNVKLINLDYLEEDEFYDKSIEEIAEHIQGVEDVERSKHYQDMKETAKEYYTLLQKAQTESINEQEIKEIKNKLDELMIPYAENPAYRAFLEMERAVAGLGD